MCLCQSKVLNKAINPDEVFKLADLVPYQNGRIVNMDVIHNFTMKFVVMAFDAGTGLSEHAAPAEAMIFALDGEGIIGCEGEEHTIKAARISALQKAAATRSRRSQNSKWHCFLSPIDAAKASDSVKRQLRKEAAFCFQSIPFCSSFLKHDSSCAQPLSTSQ